MDANPPVIVVGAGLAGLACAAHLHREGVPVLVLEAGDAVGGRVRTDRIQGFTLDRGFQVLNTGYPALRRLDLASLALRRLPRGVRLRRGGRIHVVPHPLNSQNAPKQALLSGAASAREKLALAKYAGSVLARSPRSLKQQPDLSARQAWSDALPGPLVDEVMTPFFTGVMLDDGSGTSRVFADLMVRMFATSGSAVPALGMQRLPELIAAWLPADALRLETMVASVREDCVRLASGEELDARAVVVATDPWTAYKLLPRLGTPPPARGVSTHYFAVPTWPGVDPMLVVDADGSGIANSVVLTASAPEYSGDGRALVSTSVVHQADRAPLSVDEVAAHAAELHQSPVRGWEHLASYDLPNALPGMPPPHSLRKPTFLPAESTDGTLAGRGIWVTGDHRDTSSIQGALVSGGRAASSVQRHLRARARPVLGPAR